MANDRVSKNGCDNSDSGSGKTSGAVYKQLSADYGRCRDGGRSYADNLSDFPETVCGRNCNIRRKVIEGVL